MKSRYNAFTLIELLVVMAIIAALAGVAAFSFGGANSGGVAVQNAQGTLSSLVSGVRASAALQNRNAGLFVNVTPGDDGFLHELLVAVEVAPNVWHARGESIQLPSEVYVVPKVAAAGAATFAIGASGDVQFGGTWNTGSWDLRSTGMKDAVNAVELKNEEGVDLGPTYLALLELQPVGQTVGNGKITLAPAKRASGGQLLFDDPNSVRGLTVSNYGVSRLLNDAQAMKN
jgi:prepilin-type N-terminal cleavage/methylation domain-containing protein